MHSTFMKPAMLVLALLALLLLCLSIHSVAPDGLDAGESPKQGSSHSEGLPETLEAKKGKQEEAFEGLEESNDEDVALMLRFYRRVCDLLGPRKDWRPKGLKPNVRTAPLALREQLFELLAEQPSLPALQQRTRPPLKPNCKMTELYPNILNGLPRSQPAVLIDMPTGMGGGPELDFLEIRILELQGTAKLTLGK